MYELDKLVTDHLAIELLQTDRLEATLASLWTGRAARQTEVDGRIGALATAVRTAEDIDLAPPLVARVI